MAQHAGFGIRQPRWLLLLAIAVFIIESLNAIGWWSIQRMNRSFEIDPGGTAVKLASSPLLELPPAILWSRRLDLSNLAGAPRKAVESALKNLSLLQQQTVPADPRGWLNAARLELLRGRLIQGKAALDKALLRDPTNPFSLRLMALIFRAEGRMPDALKVLAEAEAYAPGFREPPLELQQEDIEWVSLEGARIRLKAYPRLRIESSLRLEQLLRAQGKTEEASRLLDSISGNPRADLLRGRLALAAGKLEEASKNARNVASQSRLPSRIRGQAYSLLAEVHAQEHDMDGAVAAAARARQLAPELSDPYRALARISERRGDLKDALAQLRRAWGMSPSNVGVLSDLARVAEATGQKADARLALERIVKLQPLNAAAAQRYADFLLRHGDYMDAAMALSTALERNPTDAGLLLRAEKLHRDVVSGKP